MSRLSERIENFDRVFLLFKQVKNAYQSDMSNDIYKLALTQSFEIVFELGWKVLKDRLSAKGIDVYAPKDVIKESFAINILPNAQIWIDMLKDRNSSMHEYNQQKVDLIIDSIASVYFSELENFHNEIKGWND